MFPRGGTVNSQRDQRQYFKPGSPVVLASLEILSLRILLVLLTLPDD